MKKKMSVLAMQYTRANVKEISEKLGVPFTIERSPDGKVTTPGQPVPLVEGDWIIKTHKGFKVVSESFFYDNFTAHHVASPLDVDQEKLTKTIERLNKVIKSVSKMPYSKERDFVLHNLDKSKEALEDM